MDANAHTGKRDRGGGLEYAQVVGPYGRHVLNDNGEHLVRTAANAGMTIENTFFSTESLCFTGVRRKETMILLLDLLFV